MLFMKNVYLYNRRVKNGAELKSSLKADRIFDDYKGTDYHDLALMISLLQDGDVVAVYALSDFGKGAKAGRIQRQIEDAGATVQIIGNDSPPKAQGRPPRPDMTVEKFDQICLMWYSPADQSRVEEKFDMNRSQLNYLCGPRDGSKKAEKRAVIAKRASK